MCWPGSSGVIRTGTLCQISVLGFFLEIQRNKECGVAWDVTSQQHGMWVLPGPRGMALEQSLDLI